MRASEVRFDIAVILQKPLCEGLFLGEIIQNDVNLPVCRLRHVAIYSSDIIFLVKITYRRPV
jgi:hypothetical protein